MDVKCEDCNEVFVLTEEQEKNVKEFAERGNHFMISRCPLCHSTIMLHPLSLMGITDELPIIEDERLFYCPIPCCIGFVEYDKEKNIFNCAECGSICESKAEIFKSISQIIKKYPHRKSVYKKIKNGWKSIETGSASDDYYSKVQNDEKM